jgi:hypothetical protein
MPNPHVTISAKGSLLQRILGGDELHKLVLGVQDEIAADAEIVFASYALHRTGRMGRGIHTVKDGDDLIVEVEARNPETGFDYVRITRFGHRTFRIVPRRPFAASVVATRRGRSRGHQAALRWVQTDGTTIYRRSSRGFHPAKDWAHDALPQIKVRAQRRMGTLARRVEVAWKGGE